MGVKRAAAILCALGGAAQADERIAYDDVGATAGEPSWLTYAALRNDIFELVQPIDDVGFTHDSVFALRRQHRGMTFGGGVVHRWITSSQDRRRWDQLDVFASGERAWPHRITTAVRVGPTFAGNFGARYVQNGWHSLGAGSTIEHGLANQYDGGRKAGFVTGGRARGVIGERVQGFAVVDGQLAVGGTGVTSFETAAGGAVMSSHVGAHVELAVTRYHVTDPNLELPGAYGSGWQLEWRVGVHVRWSHFRVGYEYRENEGGSDQPIGLFEFSSRT